MVTGAQELGAQAFTRVATDAGSWTASPPVTLAPATGDSALQLSSVSCTAATACTAVGAYFDDATAQEVPLAERWNGTRWTRERVPLPAGETSAALTGVSCASATVCSAVGDAGTTDYNLTVAFGVSWNASGWRTQAMTFPAGASTTWLTSVSCPAAGTCTAFGGSSGAPGRLLAERLTTSGTTGGWASQPVGAGGYFYGNQGEGVSCTGISACAAVSTGDALAWTSAAGWGGPFGFESPPGDGPQVWALGVSCTTPATCTAAGYSTAAVDVPVAERLG
jgi:hypothetical protein